MLSTIFDKEEKIWKGKEFHQFYDRNLSFGQIAFEEMRRKAKDICQISDTENISLTFGEVRLQAIRIARHFENLGIKQSDVIGIFGQHTSFLMALIVACFFHGSAYQALSPNFDKKTVQKLFEKTKPKLVFCDGQEIEKIKFSCINLKSTKIYTLKNHVDGIPTILDLMQATGDEEEYEPAVLELGPEQTLTILCSSGSSGVPKAVTMPHCNRTLTRSYHLTNADVYLATSTMDWISAQFFLMSSIVCGLKRIITDKPLTPEYFLELVEKYKVTVVHVIPLMMLSLIKLPDISSAKLNSIRHFMYGGYKCSPLIPQEMQALLKNGKVIHAYALSEFNAGITLNFNFKEKPDSVGQLLNGVKACIVSTKNGEKLGPNERGEIWCRHDTYWGGYYGDEVAARGIYDEAGWFRTGDVGYFDDDSFLFIVDRLKDYVMYQVEWFFPSEVENTIIQIPDVKDVCVFGVEDEFDGERAAAAVVLVDDSKLTAQDIVEYVRQHEEAYFKQLLGGCKIYKNLPKTANMKVNRRATKALFMEGKTDKWFNYSSL